MVMREEFVISRSSVQSGSPAPVFSTTYRRYVGTAISSVVVILALFCLPTAAQAEDRGLILPASIFGVAQGLDVWTTHRARASGNGVEANPLMDVSTGGQVAIKAAASVGIIWLTHKIGRTKPKLAKGLLYGLSGLVVGVAVRNEAIARRR